MNLEDFMLHVMNQTYKDRYCVTPPVRYLEQSLVEKKNRMVIPGPGGLENES